ncbi:MAG: hypothetical protein R3C05_28715 [Pirellulaceae bacterium]
MKGSETENDRIACENSVGIVDVLLNEIDSPSDPSNSFINNHLLSMLSADGGRSSCDAATVSNAVNSVLNPILVAIGIPLNPIEAATDAINNCPKELIKSQIKTRLGSTSIKSTRSFRHPHRSWDSRPPILVGWDRPICFQAGDQADSINCWAFPTVHIIRWVSAEQIPGFTFHAGAVGGLKDNVVFDKEQFAAYANSVSIVKLSLLGGGEMDRFIEQESKYRIPCTNRLAAET